MVDGLAAVKKPNSPEFNKNYDKIFKKKKSFWKFLKKLVGQTS